MSADTLFTFLTPAVLPAWLALILFPGWKLTTRLINAVVVPGLFGVVYLVLVWRYFGSSGGGYDSLEDVASLMSEPYMLLAGWIHYLAFDLFVGAWEVRDARRLGIRHLWVIPCLVLTFMFGPVGLLAYLVLRAALKKQIWLEEGKAATPAATAT